MSSGERDGRRGEGDALERLAEAVALIESRLAAMERRLARLEMSRAVPPALPGSSVKPAQPVAPESPVRPVKPGVREALGDVEPADGIERLLVSHRARSASAPPTAAETPERASTPARGPAAPAPPVAPLAARDLPPAAPRASGGGGMSLEQLLGGRAFAVVGSLVVVLAVGLGLKLAWDAGYIRVPPAVRCVIAAGFGLVLMAVGEVMRRRVSTLSGFGFTAAGLGVVYTSAWAAHGYFELVSAGVGLGLMAGAAGLGVVTSALSRVPAVSVLGLLGGFAAPLLLRGAEAGPVAMPAYFTALMAVGLLLAAWRGPSFGGARSMGVGGAVVLGGMLVSGRGGEDGWVSLVFLGALVALPHLEMAWSAWRERLGLMARGRDGSWDASRSVFDGDISDWLARYGGGTGALLLSPLVVTTGVASAIYVLDRMGLAEWRWVAPAAGVGLLGAVCWGLSRAWSRHDARVVGGVAFVEALALVFVAVSLGFEGWAEPLVFFAMGTAVVWGSRLRGVGWMAWYGSTSLAIAVVRLVGEELGGDGFAGVFVRFGGEGGLALSSWTWQALVSAGCVWMAAWGMRRARVDAVSAHASMGAMIVCGAALVFAAPMHQQTPAAALWLAWGVLTLVAVGMRLRLSWKTEALGVVAIGGLLATSIAWGMADLGLWEMLGLGLLGVCFVWSARFGTHATFAWAGLVAMVLLSTRAAMSSGSASPFSTWAGIAWSEWSLAAGALAALWGLGAGGLRGIGSGSGVSGGVWRRCAAGSLCVGAMFLYALPAHEESGARQLFVWLLMLAGVWAGVSWLAIGRLARALAIVGLVLAAWAWFVGFARINGVAWSAYNPDALVHPGLIAALVWAAVTVGIGAMERARPSFAGESRALVLLLWWLAGSVVFVTSSLEVSRIAMSVSDTELSQRAAVSMYWGVFGAALLGGGWAAGSRSVRLTGLGLIALATGKALVFDLAGVDPLWRVVALLALGLLMMVVAAFYLRGLRSSKHELDGLADRVNDGADPADFS